ncbi:hypothetical protein DENIT_90297 [Pseudomonas veronii]|nr:hypothetical protein DENIT_90297 [Pseudomonas veronii]
MPNGRIRECHSELLNRVRSGCSSRYPSCSSKKPIQCISKSKPLIRDLNRDLKALDGAGCQRFPPERKKDPKVLVSIADRIQWNSVALCLERETRLELATPTLARSCSTN